MMDNSIIIKNVSKTINGQLILNEVSMNVKKGEIYGFLGANEECIYRQNDYLERSNF